MIDADLELRLQRWLAAEAAVTYPPEALRRRILDIPAVSAPAGSWWQRFSGLPLMSAGVATAGVAGLLIATMFFGLFDRPAGTEGETCSNRQVQQALDNLRDAPGYRFVNRDEMLQLDTDAGLSFDDPQYAWTQVWVSEGAYLAPDRAVDRPTFTLPSLYDRGYLEHLQVDGRTYRLVELDGEPTWVEDTNWPTANLAYGYIGAAWSTFSVPLVSGASWGETTVSPDLPGSGGCTAATLIPLDAGIPAGREPRRAVALRIDVASLRPTAILIGPGVGEPAKEGNTQSSWELTWETPDPAEFPQPTGAVPDPNLAPGSFVATPSPVAPESPTDAWQPIRLPADTTAGNASSVVVGDGRYVAVGGSFDPQLGLMWTSTDGVAWERLDLEDAEGLNFGSVAWNGEIFVAIAMRDVSAEGERLASSRPETWVSDDGVSWEQGGEIGPAATTGEVANPGRPIYTGTRWVAGGSIWTEAAGQQRPAFFVSDDALSWRTIELEDVGSGSLGTVVATPEGGLVAMGCESPGRTNSGQFGESCYQRPWLSDTGLEWTPGEISDLQILSVVRWGDRLLGVGERSDPTHQTDPPNELFVSADGVAWEPIGAPPEGVESLALLETAGEELVVVGQVTDPTMSFYFATAWRSSDGEEWTPIPLGFEDGWRMTQVVGVVPTDSGITLVGIAQISDFESVPVIWAEPAAD